MDPLDLLYQELTIAHKAKKVKGPQRLTHRHFAPSTWRLVRTVTLIHKPSDTVLGNFRESHHPDLPGARKLTRVTEPATTEGIEFVTGELWLSPLAEDLARPERWVTFVEKVIGITLQE